MKRKIINNEYVNAVKKDKWGSETDRSIGGEGEEGKVGKVGVVFW